MRGTERKRFRADVKSFRDNLHNAFNVSLACQDLYCLSLISLPQPTEAQLILNGYILLFHRFDMSTLTSSPFFPYLL